MEQTTLTREYQDAGIKVELTVPDSWLEYDIPGALWCLGQPVDAGTAPNVTLNIDRTDGPDRAIGAVRAAVGSLDDVEVGVEEVAERDGLPSVAVGYAFRDGEGTVLVQTLLCSVVDSSAGPIAVTVVGTCGGDSPEEAVRAISDATSSLKIRPIGGDGV